MPGRPTYLDYIVVQWPTVLAVGAGGTFFLSSFICLFILPLSVVVVVALLFYVHGKHLRSCRDGLPLSGPI